MKTLCVIPARFGSQRFPGKPLHYMLGRTMIEWVYKAAFESKAFDELVIATDDNRISEAVKAFGGEVMMTSDAHESGTDRLIEVIQKHSQFDFYFNLQGDEPLMDPDLLRQMVKKILTLPQGSILTPVHRANQQDLKNPNVVKVVFDGQNRACYFSRAPIPFQRGSSSAPDEIYKHIGLYGFSKSVLEKIQHIPPHPVEQMERLEQLRWLLNGLPIYVYETRYQSLGVDTLEQARQVEKLLEKRISTSGGRK